ncbi:hypothetical protein RAS1_20430 [Phycisphaerae bacterium RAS1]|nr:hypothetical protein RAS1_20430 [Phycisphaerae bacterium RAS1]
MRTDPYCSNCGYTLKGLTDSSKCPECGKPIVDVLTRDTAFPGWGKRYRSTTTIFGLPLLDVALGPHGAEKRGHARGIIAYGDIATGVIAIGAFARGVIAFGSLAVGVVAIGAMNLGLLALGGVAVGLLGAVGGVAAGGITAGGMTVGGVAQGGLAIGHYARGGMAIGTHTISGVGVGSPVAQQFFKDYAWLLGGNMSPMALMTFPIWLGCMIAMILVIIATLLTFGYLAGARRGPDTSQASAP